MNKPSTNDTMKFRSNYIYENTIKKNYSTQYRMPSAWLSTVPNYRTHSVIYEYKSVNKHRLLLLLLMLLLLMLMLLLLVWEKIFQKIINLNPIHFYKLIEYAEVIAKNSRVIKHQPLAESRFSSRLATNIYINVQIIKNSMVFISFKSKKYLNFYWFKVIQ